MLISIVYSLLIPTAAIAQQAPQLRPDPLDAIAPALTKYIDSSELSGAVAVVGRTRGTLKTVAVGKRTLDPATPMTEDTLFRIASMSKPIAAMAVMILVEDHEIRSIDDPVERYLPEFQGQMLVESRTVARQVLTKPSRPITLKDLLTHTSGLPSDYHLGVKPRYYARQLTLAETTFAQSQRPLDFAPGTKWSYCNAGIDTLGRVVEVVSGQGYEEFLQARLFRPLGMTNTTTRPTLQQLARLATVYERKAGKLTPTPPGFLDARADAVHPIPMGGLVSTAADLARLYRALLCGGALDGVRVIQAKTLLEMTKTQTGDLKCGFTEGMSFGLGFAVVRTPIGVTEKLSPGSFGHGGAFGTQSWADPTQDLFVILLIARSNIPNSDASPYRRELQRLAVEAISK